jgi:hypothetical protein
MRPAFRLLSIVLLASGLRLCAQEQQHPSAPQPATPPSTAAATPHGPGPGHDIGAGSADIGKGAGRGAAHIAEGAGKGAVDLVTLHPVSGAAEVGKGAATGGKDIAVGTAKGTARIIKGTGKGLRKIF